MSEIKIPFNVWSKSRLSVGCKTATSRTKRYGKVGDVFIVDGIRYELILVVKLPLWFIADNFYKSEGAFSSQEFINVWISIHPRKGFDKNEYVWYHLFRKIDVDDEQKKSKQFDFDNYVNDVTGC